MNFLTLLAHLRRPDIAFLQVIEKLTEIIRIKDIFSSDWMDRYVLNTNTSFEWEQEVFADNQYYTCDNGDMLALNAVEKVETKSRIAKLLNIPVNQISMENNTNHPINGTGVYGLAITVEPSERSGMRDAVMKNGKELDALLREKSATAFLKGLTDNDPTLLKSLQDLRSPSFHIQWATISRELAHREKLAQPAEEAEPSSVWQEYEKARAAEPTPGQAPQAL